jgi:N-acetylglutamate synthase-like GNAT family acetyltransferase
MNDQVVFAAAQPSDLPSILALLAAAKLPTEDVHEHLRGFILVRVENVLAGVAGIERHGDHVLLRSVCVVPQHRGKGLATRLCERLLEMARAEGRKQAHLLTTSAADYFRRQGFVEKERSEAPAEIQQTLEFRSICPVSAVYLTKAL